MKTAISSLQPMYEPMPYSPTTMLAQPISNTATTIEVEDASDDIFPPAPNYAVIGTQDNAETIIYRQKIGNTLAQVVRGVQIEGEARSWPAGAPIARRFTALDQISMQNNIQQIHEDIKQLKELKGLNNVSNPNLIINGNFDIWQRGVSQTTSGYGSDDRWMNLAEGSTAIHSRQTLPLGIAEIPGAIYFSRTIVNSVTGANNRCFKFQRVENGERMVAGKKVTVSFWAKADSNKHMSIEICMGGVLANTPNKKIKLSTEWHKYTFTVDFTSWVIRPIHNANTSALSVGFWFDAGSGHNSRTDNLGHQSGTFDIAQVKLEIGDRATPFVPQHIAEELALCQRYYETGIHTGLFLPFWGQSRFLSGYPYKVQKRITPAVSIQGLFGTINSVTGVGSSIDIPQRIFSLWQSNAGGFSALDFGAITTINTDNSYQYRFMADAEI